MKASSGSSCPIIWKYIPLGVYLYMPTCCILSQAVLQGGAIFTRKSKGFYHRCPPRRCRLAWRLRTPSARVSFSSRKGGEGTRASLAAACDHKRLCLYIRPPVSLGLLCPKWWRNTQAIKGNKTLEVPSVEKLVAAVRNGTQACRSSRHRQETIGTAPRSW